MLKSAAQTAETEIEIRSPVILNASKIINNLLAETLP
jgi:hypothetical protein